MKRWIAMLVFSGCVAKRVCGLLTQDAVAEFHEAHAPIANDSSGRDAAGFGVEICIEAGRATIDGGSTDAKPLLKEN